VRRVEGSGIDADAFNAFEARGWDQKALGYDGFLGQITGRLVEPLLDAAGVESGRRVLDLATGPGYAAARAAERGASVVGIDIAPAMIELAGGLHPGLEFRQADAHELPFDDASFDAALGNFLILHLGRPEQAADEFVRVLRPGGRLALTAWDISERARLFALFLGAVAESGASPPPDLPRGPDFFRFSDDEEFDALLRERALDDRSVQTIAFTHRVATAEEVWDGMLASTVRTSALISRQTDETQRRIRAAFDRLVEEYRSGEAFELPISVKLATGRKPLRGLTARRRLPRCRRVAT